MANRGVQLRLHGKIPVIDTVDRTIAMRVRDGALDRIKTFGFFKGFTFRRSHTFQLQPDQMPYCSVYFLDEQWSPDGDANVGATRFHSVVRLGFSVMIVNNDPDRSEDLLDDAYFALTEGLLRDPTFYNNDQFKIQSFVKGSRSHAYGTFGQQINETPYAELKAELSCDLGTLWFDPVIPDMLETIHTETNYPPVRQEYDIDQGDE